MNNIQQSNQQNQIKIPSKYEMKSLILLFQKKCEIEKNKTISSIKSNYLEIEKYLKTNNLDLAKIKMDNIINKENKISCLDILINNCDILKEKITLIMQNNKVPNELRRYLDSLIYSSTRLKIEEFNKFREIVQNKFGLDYIKSCDNNSENTVDQNLIEKLQIKQNDNTYIIYKLKTYCNYKKINYNFDNNFPNLNLNINNNISNNNINNNNKNSNLDCEYQGGKGFNPFINNNNNNNINNNNNNNNNNNINNNNNNLNNENRFEINYPQQPTIDEDIKNKNDESGFNLLDSLSTNNNSSQLNKGSNLSYSNESQINKSNFKSNSFNLINDSSYSK